MMRLMSAAGVRDAFIERALFSAAGYHGAFIERGGSRGSAAAGLSIKVSEPPTPPNFGKRAPKVTNNLVSWRRGPRTKVTNKRAGPPRAVYH